jgi:hypothetical protein
MSLQALFSEIQSRLPAVAAILVFRSLPFVVYACAARSVPWPRRLLLGGGGLALLTLAAGADAKVRTLVEHAPIAGAYLVLGGVLVHRLATWLPARAIKLGAVLGLGAALFVVVPARFVQHPFVVTWLILGWEVMLSAHSYCADVSSSEERPRLTDCLFFLLVNPTFVYAERGGPLPSGRRELGPGGALRVVLGTVTMLGRDVALFVAGGTALLAASSVRDGAAVTYASFVGTQAVLIVGLYCAHSGLASIQIGWMRLVGYEVPERYRNPLLSSGPQDFWLRWNVWVSRWAQRYVYVPVAHAFVRRRPGRTGPAAAVMAAFVVVGLLHDLGVYAFRLHDGDRGMPGLRLTLVFVVLGLVVVSSAAAGRRAAPFARRGAPGVMAVMNAGSRLVWIHVACALGALALPVLRSGTFAPAIEELLRRVVRVG